MEATPEIERIETLLTETDWVRRLARGLVKSEQEVDDVVQETWLAALRRPPRAEGSARGWLGTVARNAVRSSRRSAGARAGREHDHGVGRAENASPSPDALLERLELQENLSRQVRSLAPELAEVVTLRYLEGMSSAAIARSRGIPEGTVRWRLQRALEVLRERLDSEFDGGRSTWMALFAPLATLPVRHGMFGTLGGGFFAKVLTAVFSIPFLTKFAALVALFLLALTALRSRGAENAPDAGSAAPAQVAALASNEGADDTPQDATQRAVIELAPDSALVPAVDPDEPPLTRVRMRVVDANGGPASGVRVEANPDWNTRIAHEKIYGDAGPLLLLQARAEMTQVSDSQGLVAFESTLLRAPGVVIFKGEAPNFSGGSLRASISPGDELELGDLVLAAGGAVRGRVLLANGRRAEEIRVRVSAAEIDDEQQVARNGPSAVGSAVTDDDGEFELVGIPPGDYRLFASSERWEWGAPFIVAAGQVTNGIELALETDPTQRAIVRAYGADGELLERAKYEMVGPGGVRLSGFLNDGESDFTMTWSSLAGGQLTIEDANMRHQPRVVDPLPTQMGPIDVYLRPALSIETNLQVVDGEGSELEEAVVTLTREEGDATFETDSHGRVTLPLPLGDSFELHVRSSGFAAHEQVYARLDNIEQPWTVVLSAHPGIHGIVTAEGEPVRRASVELVRVNPASQFWVRGDYVTRAGDDLDSTRTESDGAFRLAGDFDGDFLVRVSRRGWADALVRLPEYRAAEGGDLAIELTRGGSVEGLARGADGTPLASGMVLLDHPLFPGRLTNADRDGRFRFENVPAGEWSLRPLREVREQFFSSLIDAPGWERELNCVVVDAETTHLDVGFERDADLRIDLQASFTGVEVPEVKWSARVPEEWDPVNQWWQVGEGSDGHLNLPGRAPSELSVWAPGRLAGRLTRRIEAHELPAQFELDVALGILRGRTSVVPEGNRSPVSVKASFDGWTLSGSLPVDKEGRFGPIAIPAGVEVEVGLRQGQAIVGTRIVKLAPSEERELELP